MSIYTRTGDKGSTALFGGKRISKADIQVEANGSVDELTSFIGLVNSKLKTKKTKPFLLDIQKDLYKIMGYLAGSKLDLRFLDLRVKEFEREIDLMDKKVPRLTRFILPGGSEISSWFHILRVVCRRAERAVVKFFTNSKQYSPTSPFGLRGASNIAILKYLNRLSDLFFTFARYYNKGRDVLT